MQGGGVWKAAEFTDDTQMAILVAESLLDRDGLDAPDLFSRFQTWLRSKPKDVGISTRAVLGSRLPWNEAADGYFRQHPRGSAGNGSLMRTLPAALFFARAGRRATMAAARRISALTHADPAAGDGCAIYHEMVRIALAGGDPLVALPEILAGVPSSRRGPFGAILDPGWTPRRGQPGFGSVWGALGAAIWSLQQGGSFADIVTRAVNLGEDADTLGAIAGGLAGAISGIGRIPSRWTTYLNGEVLGVPYSLDEIRGLGRRLVGGDHIPLEPTLPALPPVEIEPGLFLGNLGTAEAASPETAVISLCRTAGRLNHIPVRREIYLIDRPGEPGTDEDENPALEEVLEDVFATLRAFRAERRPVLVHCFAGRSRTGFFLRKWLEREKGLGRREAKTKAIKLWPVIDFSNARWEEERARLRG
jgi:ADP-ribosyl-[dinitrogen reductase] hydrolase